MVSNYREFFARWTWYRYPDGDTEFQRQDRDGEKIGHPILLTPEEMRGMKEIFETLDLRDGWPDGEQQDDT